MHDIIDNNNNDDDDECSNSSNGNTTSYISDSSSEAEEEAEIESEEEEEEEEEESEEESEEYGISNIPILLIPCNNFKWDNNMESEIKKHYLSCKKCNKTNNNNSDVLFSGKEFVYKELCDETKINNYLDFYFNLKCYNRDLSNKFYCYKIKNDTHDYNDNFILLYENNVN
jgi:hypothetical protein